MGLSLRVWLWCSVVAVTSCVTTPEPVPVPLSSQKAPKKPKTETRELSSEATRATLQAELLLQDGDVAGAVAELRAAVGHDQRSPYLRQRLGEALLLLGDAEGADAAADAAWHLTTDDEERTAALRLQAAAKDVLGDDDGSIAALRKALLVRPDRMASAMLADRLVKKGELALAEDVVARWMAAEPGAVDGWVSLARVFAERLEVDRAFTHLQKALAISADDEDALVLRHDLLLALGRFDEAARAARRLAQARGDGFDVRAALMQSLALQDAAEARALAKTWLDDDGGDETRLLVADAFERTGLLNDAVATLAAAPLARPLLSLEHARVLLHLHRADEAATLACPLSSQTRGLDERLHDYALSLCTRAEADLGSADDAVARLLGATADRAPTPRTIESMRPLAKLASASRRAALRQHLERLAPTADGDIAVAVAFSLDALDEHDAAMALLLRTLQKKPADPALVFAHARLLDAQAAPGAAGVDAVRGAVELVERLIERTGPDADTLNFLAFALAERDLRADEARAWAWRALLLDPLNGYVTDTLGWATLKTGDVDAAVALLRRADRLSPDEGEIVFHLAVALQKQGAKDDARAAVARARALLPKGDVLLPRVLELERELS
jgi:tetratricopeptide (TPR) repeat protein